MDESHLVDSHGRVHTSLRISVTDRCNLRCVYCMPDGDLRFLPRSELLTFEEIARLVGVATRLGVRKLRITGGEPLVRSDIPRLVAHLAGITGIAEVALTTNGLLLAEQAPALREAGLTRLNVSLDALGEEAFRRISRRDGLARVIEGIFAARAAGFEKIRLNAVSLRGISEPEVVPLGEFARRHGLPVRFIEFMPLDAEGGWNRDDLLPGREVKAILERAFGPLVAESRDDPSQPALDYRFADGVGRVGFIDPVSQPFCGDCNRLRLTAEGQLRNCLFSTTEWDARRLIRGDGNDDDLADLLRECVAAKKPGHGIDDPDFLRPERAMYQIGG